MILLTTSGCTETEVLGIVRHKQNADTLKINTVLKMEPGDWLEAIIAPERELRLFRLQ